MNQLARREAGAVARPTDEPLVSQRLASAMSAVLNPHPGIGSRVESLPAHTRVEARHALRRYEELCRPAGPAVVRRWFLPINGAVRNPLAPEDFESRAATVAALIGELPVAVFTVRTQRMAMAEFQFWPSAADVNKLLRGQAAPLIAHRDALKRLVIEPEIAPPENLTTEERERIVLKFRADMATAQAERPPVDEPRQRAKPAFLTGEALARMRQAAGVRPHAQGPATE